MRLTELNPDSRQDEREFSLSGALTVEFIQAAFGQGACFRFKVRGYSMGPFIKDGDIVTLSPLYLAPIALGRPAAGVCPARKNLVVHRIVSVKNEGYLIKGDNCSTPDGLMREKDILGCVTKIERQGRPVSLGLGPERMVIAFLSRNGLLPVIFFFWRLVPRPLRRWIKCRMLS